MSLAAAPPASAQEIKIREVFPGTTGSPNTDFIELQMFSSGQNAVGGDEVQIWGSGGTMELSFTIPTNVASGVNQATILIGDTATASATGATPDFVTSSLDVVDSTGGAVCYPDGAPADCVAWGTAGAFIPALPSGVGSFAAPTGGIPNGSSLTRSIAPGCSTLLEAADDTNDSAADFSLTSPSPRANATPPTEAACAPPVPSEDLPVIEGPAPAPPENPEIGAGAIIEEKKIDLENKPLRVRLVPDCPSGRLKGQITMARLGEDGGSVGGSKPAGFVCRKGKASFRKSGYFRLRPAWLKEAHTAEGLVLLATILVKGDGPITEPLWFHDARAAPSAAARAGSGIAARSWSGLGASCQLFSNVGYMNVAIPSTYGYPDQFLQWHTWSGIAQTWNGRYSQWQSSSSSIRYQLNASGVLLGGNIAVVGGSTGIGHAPNLLWNGLVYFPVPRGGYGRMYLYLHTAKSGWRSDYLLPGDLYGAQRFAEWCKF